MASDHVLKKYEELDNQVPQQIIDAAIFMKSEKEAQAFIAAQEHAQKTAYTNVLKVPGQFFFNTIY